MQESSRVDILTLEERALGALWGLALGDALGMPTQAMTADHIETAYGEITGLVDAIAEQPVAPLMPAGSVTDDTEQALLLADLLVAGEGHIDPRAFATCLLNWEDDMRARDSLDLLGPSTKAALEQVREGADPRITGKNGTTNGAAMRVTPIGIAISVEDPERFAKAVHESCMVTHDTHQGWEAAGLVAAAVSAGMAGASVREALEQALTLIEELPTLGHPTEKPSVLERTKVAISLTREVISVGEVPSTALIHELRHCVRTHVGTSVESYESVAAAFATAYAFAEDPYAGLCFAANLCDDTDTIAAMAGAIFGACGGRGSFPEADLALIAQVSGIEITERAQALVSLRTAHSMCLP